MGKFSAGPFGRVLVAMFGAVLLLSCGGGSTQGAPGASSGGTLPNPPAVAAFGAVQNPVTKGEPVTLLASFTGADTATVKAGAWSSSIQPGVALVGPTVTADTTFTLELANKFGQKASATSAIATVEPPVIDVFQASATSVLNGATVTLHFAFNNGAGTIEGVGKVDSGTDVVTPALHGDTTFKLTVTNAAGTSVTQTLAVAVAPVVVSPLIPANPTVTAGRTVLFSVVASGATDNSIRWSATGGTFDEKGNWTAPALPGTYTISAAPSADLTQTLSTTATVVAGVGIQSFSSVEGTIGFGGSATLVPIFTGGTGTVDQAIGLVDSGTRYPTGGLRHSTTYTLTVTNAAGDMATATTTVNVTSGTISNITPAAPTVSMGDTVSFQASVAGAADSGVLWAASDGSITSAGAWIAPGTEETVTITATSRADATLVATTTVRVVAGPKATSLIAGDLSLPRGGTTTITPLFSGGTGVVDQAVGTVTTGVGFTSGSLDSTTTFTLTVTNAAGKKDKCSVTIAVGTASISAVSPANQTVTVNDKVSFATSVFNAADASVLWTATDGTIDPRTGAWIAPAYPTSATIRATSVSDTTKTASTSVTVVAAPVIVSFQASSSTVGYGGSTNLLPKFTGGAGVVDQAVGGVTSETSFPVGPLHSALTYKLTVTNAAGASVIGFCTVQVSPVVVSGITPSNPVVTTGDSVKFASYASGTAQTALTWSTSGGTIDASGNWTAPMTPGSYEVTATSNVDASKYTITGVTVVAPPAITSFSASTLTLPYGGSVNILGVFKNGIGTVDQGLGNLASGISAPVGPLYGSRTYTLTVANLAGATAVASVTISVSEVTLSGLTPATAILSTGDSITFAATLTGAQDATLIWSATGGLITASGAWTAPAPGTYTITAMSKADNTKMASATVQVVPAPTITSFMSADAAVDNGGFTTLTGLFAHGTGILTPGPVTMTSGVPVTVGPIATATVYTLTVTNAAGVAVTATAPVGVHNVSMAPVAPANPTVTVGGTVPFSTSLTGTFNLGVVWSATVGTIDAATGIWTAPSYPTSATITATWAGDRNVSVSTLVTVVAAPSIASFITDNPILTVGQGTLLRPVFSNGVGTVSQGVGAVTTGAAAPVSPAVSTTYTLTVTNAAGTVVTATITVTVVPLPVISGFTPATSPILNGAATTLTATFTGGTGSVNQGIGAVVSGTAYPTANLTSAKTYTLTVTNPAGTTATATTTVTLQPVVVAPITPASPTVTVNGTVNFASLVTGAVDTTITWSATTGTIDASGHWTAPTYATSSVITATSVADASKTASTTVTVVSAPSISSFTTDNPIMTVGSGTVLRPVFSGGTAVVDQGVGSVTSGGTAAVNPAATRTYTLTVTNAAGTVATATVTVYVVAAPAISSFTPGASLILNGASTTLTATFSGGTGSVNQGLGAVVSGTAYGTGILTTGKTYTLTVTNTAGTTATATATVNVQGVVVAALTPASPTVTVNGSASFTSSVTGAVNTGLTWSATSGTIDASGNWTAPATPGTYTVKATSIADPSQSASTFVTVVAVPVISSFTPAVGTVNLGASTTLTATFSGGTGSVDKGVGAVTSGSPASTGALASATTFTLTVTNAGGTSVTATATVMVQTVAVTGVVPTVTSTTPGAVVAFSGTVTGAVNTGLSWSATGGTMSSADGIWRAPHAPGTYTITGTSLADGSKSATATVYVLAGPVASSFSAASSPVSYGGSTTLTGNFTGGTGSIDHGIGAVTSGNAYATAVLTAPTTYTLTMVSSASLTDLMTNGGGELGLVGPAAASANLVNDFSNARTGNWVRRYLLALGTNGALMNDYVPASPSETFQLTAYVKASAGWGGTLPNLYLRYTDATGNVQSGLNAVTSFTPTTSWQKVTLTATVPSGSYGVVPAWDLNCSPQDAGKTLYFDDLTHLAQYTAATTVGVKSVTVASVTPANPVLTAGTSATFASSVSGAVNTAITWSVSGGYINGSGTWSIPGTPGVYTVTTTATADGTTSASTQATVVAPPSISGFSATSSLLLYGDATYITPVFSGGVGSVDQGVGGCSSGVAIWTGPLYGSKTYTLTVTNTAGTTTSFSVTVTTQTVSVAAIYPANPTVTASTMTSFTSSVSGALNTGLKWSVNAGGFLDGQGIGNWTALVPPGIYTITATSLADGTKSASTQITVIAAPQISSFSQVTGSSIPYGGSATLTGEFTGGNGTVDQGVGNLTSGVGISTGPLTTATTYTLTVTNALGVKATKTYTVYVETVRIAAVTPNNPSVTSGTTTKFTSLVSGAIDTVIYWSATDGSIDSFGNWKAPAYPCAVTITAQSRAVPSKTAVTVVLVYAVPTISSFTVTPSTINAGDSSILSWATGGGTSNVTIAPLDGFQNGAGDINVSPSSTTTYTLTATNAIGGTTTATATVTVLNTLPICNTFTVSQEYADGSYTDSIWIDGTFDSWVLYTPQGGALDGGGSVSPASAINTGSVDNRGGTWKLALTRGSVTLNFFATE